jgi:glycosyltransferase involved in cell wall biosynthesis
VIDGASKDQTQEIIAGAQDVVTFTVSERDYGFFDALNKGVRAVRTDYYVVLGADDVLFPDAIANYKAWAEQTGADMLIANVKAGNKIRRGYKPQNAWLGPAFMWTSHSVGTLLKRDLHKRFGEYSLRYPIYADSLFMKRVALSPETKVAAADFVAGEFSMDGGFSKENYVRSLCELWMVQRETGENPLLQYALFQLRLLRRLGRAVAR